MQVNRPTQPSPKEALGAQFSKMSEDGRISNREARQLNKFIDSTNMPEGEKEALKGMISELNDATTDNFLFFSWKSKIDPSEMKGLQKLADSNPLAKNLLNAFQSAKPAPTQQRLSQNSTQTRQSAGFTPNSGLNFGSRIGGSNTGGVRAPSRIGGSTGSIGNVPDWILTQGTGLPSRGGDCGPTCAAMIAKRFGFLQGLSNQDAVQTARNASGVTRPNGGAWAITEGQLSKSVAAMTGGQVSEQGRTGLLKSGSANQASIANALKDSLAKGEMPFLLTGSPSTSSRHYMIVTEVKQDANGNDVYMMADPGGGRVWPMTEAKLTELMAKADKRGGSNVVSFGPNQ